MEIYYIQMGRVVEIFSIYNMNYIIGLDTNTSLFYYKFTGTSNDGRFLIKVCFPIDWGNFKNIVAFTIPKKPD